MSIHGHEFMRTIIAEKNFMTKEEIIKLGENTFGKEMKFHACSAEGMSFGDFLLFLENKGKLIERD